MANTLYPLGAKAILDASINFLSDDIRFALIDTGVETYNAADQFMSSVTSPVARMAASVGTKVTNGPAGTTPGTFDCADPTINSVSGSTVEAVILYKYNASDAAAALICWIDSSPSIAFTPNGSNVTLTIDSLGVFSI
jgi:hypothetical protein